MSELTLTDVTQVLLKQNQELTVNTAETKDTKASIAELSRVLGDYFKNQQRLDEGDRLENKRESSKAKAGGGGSGSRNGDIESAVGELGAFGLPFFFLGAIRSLIFGMVSALTTQVKTVLKTFRGFLPKNFFKPVQVAIKSFYIAIRAGLMAGFNPAKMSALVAQLDPNKIVKINKFTSAVVGLFTQVGKFFRVIVDSTQSVQKFFGRIVAFFGSGAGSFRVSIVNYFKPLTNAFTAMKSALKGAGVIGKGIAKVISAIQAFIPQVGAIMKSVGAVFFQLGRAVLFPLQIIIGAVQFIRGFIDGIFQNDMDNLLQKALIGMYEGFRMAFNTLVSSFIDMIINAVGFIVGFFSEDAGQALKDFSFKDMFNAYIDTLIGFVRSPMESIKRGFQQIAKFPAAIFAGGKAALEALAPGGESPMQAFSRVFNESIAKSNAAINLSSAKIDARKQANSQMELDELNKQIDSQGGGATIVDGSSNIQNNGDNVNLSTSTEEPVDNKNRLKRGSRGSRGR